MVKIALDAGHGLNVAGKQTPDGIKEWTLNDKVRDKVVDMLKAYDVTIVHTDKNEGKTNESLSERVNTYKKAGVASVISIHHNAHTGKWNNATGVEVYVDKNCTDKDMKLANLIYARLVAYTGLKGRGVKKANFQVINQNSIPAVLVEGGFMDGTKDYKVITSDEGQTGYAKAVAEALIEFHSLKKKTTKTETKTETKSKTSYTLKQFIKDVQKACGASVDGIAGPETLSKTVTLSAKKNSKHAAVKAVQKRLAALGYTQVGTADGVAGPKFTSAVAHFQQDNKCVVDGEITAKNKTWKKLLGMA